MVPRLRDHSLDHWGNLAYLGELVEAGVRAYLFEPGFLHSKTNMVDGAVVSVGSANKDIRSFELNYETNAVVYCRKVATSQEQVIFRDLQESRQWTLSDHLSRSPSVRLWCALVQVFTSLL
jgi:cardiolipin synthase